MPYIKNIHTNARIEITIQEAVFLAQAGDIYKTKHPDIYYPDEHDWKYILKRVAVMKGR